MRPGDDAAGAARMLDANPGLIEAASETGVTPLMLAVMENNLDIAALLLDRGANIDADFTGLTALRWAVDERNERAARLLLDRGADWTIADLAGVLPYDEARSKGCDGIVSAIEAKMAAGAPPGRAAPPHKDALDITVAAAQGKAGELRQIVADYPDSPRWREPVTGAPGVEDAAFLLARGADVNAQDAGGWTPLMHAVDRAAAGAFTDLLLAHGADPLLANREGDTAADIARRNGNPDLAKILRYELERSMAGTQGPLKLGKPLVLRR